MNAINTIKRIQEDFEQEHAPFDTQDFPEKRLLDELGSSDYNFIATQLTAFSTLDYNRDAMRLAENLIELYRENTMFLHPGVFTDSSYDEDYLAAVMSDIGFRYPNRDAHALVENWAIITEKYGTVRRMISESGYNAPALVQQLRDDGFLCIKGKKIAPMYARFINQYLEPLEDMWELDIPVDTHIRQLSHKLFDNDQMTDDEIRTMWKLLGAKYSTIEPHVVDGALWLIGNNWNDWGEGYWESV